ncbi:glycosyltransferase [Brevibacterium sp.]|uniref:glycosyltransferase family protein n=1 Tax=Brevibacterium sp. TaxID=1701 RepID=UPI0025B9C1E4|nr:glycosyltransferase [Brevibacterium sp.]
MTQQTDGRPQMTATVVLYSHDSVGLGHARRNRALAHALAEHLPGLLGEEVSGLLIAGHPDAPADSLPDGWDWLVLPGFDRTDDGYAARRLRLTVERLAAVRGATMAGVMDSLSPDLFIADRHPLGVDGELRPVLSLLRERHRCATVLGLRDVLDSPWAVQAEWAAAGGAEAVADAYDAVWIYGDRRVYCPVSTGEVPAGLASRSLSTGYLAQGRPEDAGAAVEGSYVLTVVGGGSDGAPVARAAAAAPPPRGHRHLVVTGPQMPEEQVRAIRLLARPETTVLRSVPHVPALLRDAAAAVTMGGYNTLAEVMATTTPALVVPRRSRRAEQPRRAAALAAAGAVEVLPAEACEPQALSAWFAKAVGTAVDRSAIDLGGLSRAAELAAQLIRARRAAPMHSPHPTGVPRARAASRPARVPTPLEALAHAH